MSLTPGPVPAEAHETEGKGILPEGPEHPRDTGLPPRPSGGEARGHAWLTLPGLSGHLYVSRDPQQQNHLLSVCVGSWVLRSCCLSISGTLQVPGPG